MTQPERLVLLSGECCYRVLLLLLLSLLLLLCIANLSTPRSYPLYPPFRYLISPCTHFAPPHLISPHPTINRPFPQPFSPPIIPSPSLSISSFNLQRPVERLLLLPYLTLPYLTLLYFTLLYPIDK